MHTARPHILAAIAALFAVIALLMLIGSHVHSIDPTSALASTTHPARTCFSAQAWSGDDSLRPCVRVTNVEEDGSFHVQVQDASGTTRYDMSIGNPVE